MNPWRNKQQQNRSKAYTLVLQNANDNEVHRSVMFLQLNRNWQPSGISAYFAVFPSNLGSSGFLFELYRDKTERMACASSEGSILLNLLMRDYENL